MEPVAQYLNANAPVPNTHVSNHATPNAPKLLYVGPPPPPERTAHSDAAGVVIVGIFKNEALSIPEWCNFYLRDQGVAHIYLIDNGSDDDWKTAIAPYAGQVTVVSRRARHKQIHHYNSYIPTLKAKHPNDWVLVVDMDEYVYARKPGSTLQTVVRDELAASGKAYAKLSWTLFGSSGWKHQPASVPCSFAGRTDYTEEAAVLVKTMVAVDMLCSFGIHTHFILKGWTKSPWFRGWLPTLASVGSFKQAEHSRSRVLCTAPSPFMTISEAAMQSSSLQLNHYPIQSEKWFRATKMTRGSASTKRFDKIRNMEYVLFCMLRKIGKEKQSSYTCYTHPPMNARCTRTHAHTRAQTPAHTPAHTTHKHPRAHTRTHPHLL